MFEPETEARFKRIEDALAATAESHRQTQESQRQMQESQRQMQQAQRQMQESQRQMQQAQEESDRRRQAWEHALQEAHIRTEQALSRKITLLEDGLTVEAEMQHRFELRAKEDMARLARIQNAMAKWQDEMSDALAELTRTVDRFLKARTNGGAN